MKQLTEGRYRQAVTDAQVRAALHDPCSTYAQTEAEALVCLLRHFRETGASRQYDAVAALIHQRASTRLEAWALRALPYAGPYHQEQLSELVIGKMWECLLSDAPGNEFWEIAFWLCLKRRFLSALNEYVSILKNELSLITRHRFGDGEHDECSYIDLAVGANMDDTLSRMMLQEAMSSVPPHCLRALICHSEGRPQEETAEEYSVSGRTIRNWITEAKTIIRAYYKQEAGT